MAAALISLGALTACGGNAPSGSQADSGTWAKSAGTIVFGATPDQAGSDSNNKPLEDYIAKTTGYKVEYYPTSDYTALIAAAVAGKVDMITSGALQYVMAVNKGAKLTPVAATLTSPKVQDPGYYSEAIVPAGSPITTLADAKGKKVCFVDPNSTSGFLFGLYQLHQAGLDVNSSGTDANGNPTFNDFTAYFAGAHDKSEQTVASKQCDVGFAEDTVVDPAVAKGEVTVIGKEYVPGGPLAISTTLPADAQAKLTAALQGATLDAIKASGVPLTEGFTQGYFGAQKEDASYYKSISDLCTSIPAAKCSK
ncbi:phosphate/phosphite/phosphonate ABC transporter substrate-binding protein [Pseudonocardia xinjiangensis]|uniref:phosphate/phosphite/phosphonate ABC transporter substrate-binding protein n=1 Tax=Pseudonocardia xinjiangensis TaxID=75289 RepID=UPI003D91AF76